VSQVHIRGCTISNFVSKGQAPPAFTGKNLIVSGKNYPLIMFFQLKIAVANQFTKFVALELGVLFQQLGSICSR
jgi:hypothetical protein